LVDAISDMFLSCGSWALCSACFAGKLHTDHKGSPGISKGCCGGCRNLSATGCVQKPLGCALGTCSMMLTFLPRRLRDFLWRAEEWLVRRSIWTAPLRTLGFQIKHSNDQLKAMLILAKRFRRVVAWMKRTGYPRQNGPLLDKVMNADSGTFTGNAL
jgi:hypothetical protein